MFYKSLFFGATFDDGPKDFSAAEFADQIGGPAERTLDCGAGGCVIGAARRSAPAGGPSRPGLVNEERLGDAAAEAATIERLGSLEGFVVETLLVQKTRHALIEQSPPAVLLQNCASPRPTNESVQQKALAEADRRNPGSGRFCSVPPRCRCRRISQGCGGADGSARRRAQLATPRLSISGAELVKSFASRKK